MSERPNINSLVAGASIGAIIPTSIEEVWRVATIFCEAGLAPQSLIGKKPKDNASEDEWGRFYKRGPSAVATVIMSGAELGLPPMVSLRAFAVINGRPALFGDGLINVVRRSGRAAFIQTGYDEDRQFGWCEAKRNDTGEVKRVEFSKKEALRAGLWDDRETVKRENYYTKKWEDKPNDAPWHRYPQRMCMWRAAGYCLRDLFADVLGGVLDEFEAREIEERVINHDARETAPSTASTPPSPPSPPKPPSPSAKSSTPPSPPPTKVAAPSIEVSDEDGFLDAASEDSYGNDEFDFSGYFSRLEAAFEGAHSDEDIEEVWNDFDPEAQFQNDPQSRELADNLKQRFLNLVGA